MKQLKIYTFLALTIALLLFSGNITAKKGASNGDEGGEITELPREIISNQDVIEGGLVYHDSEDGYLEVYPHTVYNPQLQWQYINITSKKADDFDFIADFYSDLEWLIIEEWKLEPQPYTYCIDEQGNDCQTKWHEYYSWVDVTSQFVKEKKNGKDQFKTKTLKKLAKDESRLFRIRYQPTTATGKWDLVLQDKTNKKITLDPWWSGNEQNVTQGFVYLTNVSKTDTFRDYEYELVTGFETTTGWFMSVDAQDLALTTARVEGTDAFEYLANISKNPANNWSQLYTSIPFTTYNVTGTDAFGLYMYINDSTQIDTYRGIRMIVYSDHPDDYCHWYTGAQNLNLTIIDGWNFFVIPFNKPSGCSNNGTVNGTADRINLYVYNTGVKNHIVRWDNLFAYNTSNYYNKTWFFSDQAKNNLVFGLQKRDNGFGFNKTMLAIGRTSSNVYPTHIFTEDFSGGDFEMIAILPQGHIDFGTDICSLAMGGQILKQAVWWTGQNVFRFHRPDGSSVAYPWTTAISPDENFYVKFQSIDNIHYWYYSNDTGVTWQLGLNYTEVYETDRIRYRIANGVCFVHSLIFRELLPQYNPAGDYHASFMYQSSEAATWDRYRWQSNKDGSLHRNSNDYTPLDSEIPTYDETMDYGTWYFFSYVYDDAANVGYNQTQTVLIDLGGLNITVKDEITEATITNQTVELEILGTSYAQNYTTITGTFNIPDIPAGDYELRYRSNGYDDRAYFTTIVQGTVENIDLFLLNSTFSSLIIHTLLDQNSNPAANLRILLQRNYISGDVSIFKTVQMAQTNFEGKAVLYVELYDVWYKMIYTDASGTVLKETDVSPFIELDSQDVVQLGSDFYEGWREFNNVYYNLTWVTIDANSSYAKFIYADTRNIVREGCLQVHYVSAKDYTQICDNCTVSASATISCIVDTTVEGGNYKAVASIDTTTANSWKTVKTIFLNNNLATPDWSREGIFHGTLIIGTMAFMGLATITGSIIMIIISIIGVTAVSFITGFTLGWIYYLAILGLMVIYMIRRGSR